MFSYEGTDSQQSGDNGEEVPPVPIPNTVVKLLCVEDTWRVTARENRSSPEQKTTDSSVVFFLIFFDCCIINRNSLTGIFIFDIINNIVNGKILWHISLKKGEGQWILH